MLRVDKDYKICNVLGGLDVTRLVSRNARNFFAAAIDDIELMRESLSEAVAHENRTTHFVSLEEMSRSLDWKARGLAEGSTSVDAGLGYVDDRVDRRVDRYANLMSQPLVGDKDSAFAMGDAISPIIPWIVDRKSKESSWHKAHENGESEGDEKEPFTFDALYTAAWFNCYSNAVIYYPPLTVYGHPLSLGDVFGPNFVTHDLIFIAPSMPENNPERKAEFTSP
jgi:hypothetical protein